MSAPSPSIQLIPIQCMRCQTPIQCQADEIAWVCPQCGQGLLLTDQQALETLDVHYAAGIPPNTKGRPFWVVQASVSLQRTIYGGGDRSEESRQYWQQPRTFYVPAFACTLDELVDMGMRMLLQPPQLQAGATAAFTPAVTPQRDVRPLIEFIVMGVEAGRRDNLREVQISVQLGDPSFWIIS